MKASDALSAPDSFVARHLGPRDGDVSDMLQHVGADSLDALSDEAVPAAIRMQGNLDLPAPRSEVDVLAELRAWAQDNPAFTSLLGQGYYGTILPGVIQRNILENPGWYTQYTPYQPEISQGRLEALVNYQTMVTDLTGLPLANSSLLDEATAAAEAMSMCFGIARQKKKRFLVANNVFRQTLAVVQTRAEPIGVEVVVQAPSEMSFDDTVCGVLLQYPATDGQVAFYEDVVAAAHDAKALVVMATDLLALTLLKSPGALGADIAIGSAQRFGVPLGGGGPHAAFMATKEEHKRFVPGRIIGVSKDARGKPAYRLALQTREQHIRRERATSNICTAQVLLANIAGAYAVYHGPEGLKRIATGVHAQAKVFADALGKMGCSVSDGVFFDTVTVEMGSESAAADVVKKAAEAQVNLRQLGNRVVVSFDESTDAHTVSQVLGFFGNAAALDTSVDVTFDAAFARDTEYLTHPVFHSHRSETEMLRYLRSLQEKDIALDRSMIPLGSCTMKLNATCEMIPVTWPEFGNVHPFAPRDQQAGYDRMFRSLEASLAEITGFHGCSLQPNAGSQGEYSGLLVIRAFHRANGEGHRNVCLIPTSAHGTNPASAVLAGMKVVPIKCNDRGDIDVEDLKSKCEKYASDLAALMVTYPSTHGVFEAEIKTICQLVHDAGGQVYLDGANMNAQVGLCRPGDYGADVCHLNLHKTFCIPHGGGGPGMGPICVAEHLTPYLPTHVENPADAREGAVTAVSAAPYGSPSILPISWVYIAAMGGTGLKKASQIAILNANYMAKRLEGAYPILFRGDNGRVAHEFIIDIRPFKKSAGVESEDIAKRLMDFGFHAPTMSFPVAGTLMIEPTESEGRAELDRYCDAMLAIREEIRALEEGKGDKADNPLKNAPHTAEVVTATEWARPYSREQAAYPLAWVRQSKYWPPVARVDNAWGDRNLMCTCPPMEDFAE